MTSAALARAGSATSKRLARKRLTSRAFAASRDATLACQAVPISPAMSDSSTSAVAATPIA